MTTYIEITQVKSSIGRKPDHRGTLRALGLKPIPEADTAGSARLVSEGNDTSIAAIASAKDA